MRPGVPTTSCAPCAEGVELRAVFHAAIHHSRPHPEIAAEEFCFAGDLKGQLTGGHEDQGLASSSSPYRSAPGSAG